MEISILLHKYFINAAYPDSQVLYRFLCYNYILKITYLHRTSVRVYESRKYLHFEE